MAEETVPVQVRAIIWLELGARYVAGSSLAREYNAEDNSLSPTCHAVDSGRDLEAFAYSTLCGAP